VRYRRDGAGTHHPARPKFSAQRLPQRGHKAIYQNSDI
jgi:hypothetical protein